MPFFLFLYRAVLSLLPAALLFCALFLGAKIRFFPFLHPIRTLRRLFDRPHGQSRKTNEAGTNAAGTNPAETSGVGTSGAGTNAAGTSAARESAPSPFRAASVALAGTIGVGNIAGVSLSLLYGGAGAVFWMWVCGAAAMLLKYAEVVLSHSLRTADGKGSFHGGTPHTLRALGLPRAGAVFAILCLLYSFTVGGMVQANAIAECLSDSLAVPPAVTGVLLLLLTLPVVCGGGRRISALTVRLVPLMCLLYVGATLFVIFANLPRLPEVLSLIVTDAFTPAAALGGGFGFLSMRALRAGMARGLMSNEGGCGTATFAHAESAEPDPARQGLFGLLEVGVDTLLLCTLTALCILCALPTLPDGVGGMGLVRLSLASVFGSVTAPLLSLCLFFFAYATVLSAAFYTEKCLGYFNKGVPVCRKTVIFFCFLLPVGATVSATLIWGACDLLLAAMALCNLPLLLWQSGRIRALTEACGLLGGEKPPRK